MHRSLVVTVIVVITSLIFNAAASAAPIAPYDGENPFKCKTQNTGFGVAFPAIVVFTEGRSRPLT